jgi:polar amino acid transport system permease protein
VDLFFEQYFDFGIMGDEFGYVLEGFWVTMQLALISGALALAWGLILAIIRQIPGRPAAPARWASIAYIDVFRGVPLLLVLLMLSYGLGVLAKDGAIPQFIGDPQWFGKGNNFWYGVFAITLVYGAYMAEVYRAGIEAVPRGQMEAARSLGMNHGQAMRHVIVPQAIRKVFPPLLNDFIALLKDTSLVFVLGLAQVEVVQAGKDVQIDTFNSSGYTLGALFFLAVTIPLARIVDRLIASQDAKFQRALA